MQRMQTSSPGPLGGDTNQREGCQKKGQQTFCQEDILSGPA